MGAFTITNLGQYGVTHCNAVIYPQQVDFHDSLNSILKICLSVSYISYWWC